jgi:hypothetical protein
MKIQILDKNTAYKEALRIKEKAFAIANSYNTLPGYCLEPECVRYCSLMALTQLKKDEGTLFCNGEMLRQLTDFKLENGGLVIGNICVKNAKSAEIIGNELIIHYIDGVLEYFTYSDDIEAYKFKHNSLGTKTKPEMGILN